MKKFLILVFFILALNTQAIGKETTFKKELFEKALLDGKVVVVSSWIKYCTSCASQMKILNKAKNNFDNIVYFTFDVYFQRTMWEVYIGSIQGRKGCIPQKI